MKRGKYKKLANVVYEDGYNHYDRHRNIPVVFMLNAAEKAALDDMLAASGVTNVSDFIRGQVFKAHKELTAEQKEQLKEVAKWRAENDMPPNPLKGEG